MIAITIAGLLIFLILIADEFLWRKKLLKGEAARKMTHILAGVFIAFWPYFMSWRLIQVMCLAFLIGVAVSKKFHIFSFMEAVSRRSMGEYMFALGIGVIALIQPEPWVFTLAVLHVALADGFAALVGTRWGKTNQYSVIGHRVSVVGTATFAAISMILTITALYAFGDPYRNNMEIRAALVPFIASAAENMGVYGIDNLLVPLSIVLLLGF